MEDLCLPLLLLFNFFFISPRSQKQWMDGSWECYEQLGVWCNFNIQWLDSFLRPPVLWEMGKLLQMSPKIWQCPYSPTYRRYRNQVVQHLKNRKLFFQKKDNCPTFDESYASLPFSSFGESVTDSFYKFHLRACYSSTIVRQVVLLPSRLTTAMENT